MFSLYSTAPVNIYAVITLVGLCALLAAKYIGATRSMPLAGRIWRTVSGVSWVGLILAAVIAVIVSLARGSGVVAALSAVRLEMWGYAGLVLIAFDVSMRAYTLDAIASRDPLFAAARRFIDEAVRWNTSADTAIAVNASLLRLSRKISDENQTYVDVEDEDAEPASPDDLENAINSVVPAASSPNRVSN